MKKILLILLSLLLVSCGSNVSEDQLATLQQEIDALKTSKLDLMNQVKSISEEKMTLEKNGEILQETLDLLKQSSAAMKIDNDTLMKQVEDLTEDVYEAQYNFDLKVFSVSDKNINFILEPSANPIAEHYIVIGKDANEFTAYGEADDDIVFGGENYEQIIINFIGRVYDVKWASITWNSDYSEYEVSEVLAAADQVNNQRVVINTTTTESLPAEALIWENSQGETFEIFMSYDGVGLETSLIISE